MILFINDDNAAAADAVAIGCIVDRLFFELFFDIFVGVVVVVVSISFERFFGGRPRLRFKIGIPSIDVKILVPDEYNCCNGDDICLDLFIDDLDLVIEVVGIDCDDAVAVTPGINGWRVNCCCCCCCNGGGGGVDCDDDVGVWSFIDVVTVVDDDVVIIEPGEHSVLISASFCISFNEWCDTKQSVVVVEVDDESFIGVVVVEYDDELSGESFGLLRFLFK